MSHVMPYTPLKGNRPMLHLLPRRWCLVAYKKGVPYYLKQNLDDGPVRYYKGPGVHGLAGFRRLEDAERWAARPANRLYHVEEAHRHIARSWFNKLKWPGSTHQI